MGSAGRWARLPAWSGTGDLRPSRLRLAVPGRLAPTDDSSVARRVGRHTRRRGAGSADGGAPGRRGGPARPAHGLARPPAPGRRGPGGFRPRTGHALAEDRRANRLPYVAATLRTRRTASPACSRGAAASRTTPPAGRWLPCSRPGPGPASPRPSCCVRSASVIPPTRARAQSWWPSPAAPDATARDLRRARTDPDAAPRTVMVLREHERAVLDAADRAGPIWLTDRRASPRAAPSNGCQGELLARRAFPRGVCRDPPWCQVRA